MEQALRLTEGLALGAALGLVYGLLRPLRRRAGRAAALFDVLFVLLAGAAAFVFACAAPDARLGLWELAAMLTGFLLEQEADAALRRKLSNRTSYAFEKNEQKSNKNL